MKRIFFSLCFATVLGAGLVSCSDEAAEITPISQEKNLSNDYYGTDDKGGGLDTTRPTSK